MACINFDEAARSQAEAKSSRDSYTSSIISTGRESKVDGMALISSVDVAMGVVVE